MSASETPAETENQITEKAIDGNTTGIDEGESDSDFRSELLCITVNDGKKSKKFYVSKSLIWSKPPYFAALKNFEEGQKNHVTLHEVNHHAFRQILNWVYSGNFRADTLHGAPTLINVYVTADRLMMTKCMNMAMDGLRAEFKMLRMGVSSVRHVNGLKVPVDDAVVQFVLDQYVYDCLDSGRGGFYPLSELRQLRNDMTEEIAYKMYEMGRNWCQYSRTLLKEHKPDAPASLTGCMYQAHRHDESCYLDD